jgi:hypothetical protein
MDLRKRLYRISDVQMMDGMNSQEERQEDFCGVYSVATKLIFFLQIGRQSLPNIVAVTVMAGTLLGIFSWAGGLGGFSSIYGVDIHQALEYRRKWRWYPTSTIPMEDYERAIGRKAHPEDFADINEILGDQQLPSVPTDNVGYVPVSKPNQQWWKEILEKANGAKGENKK